MSAPRSLLTRIARHHGCKLASGCDCCRLARAFHAAIKSTLPRSTSRRRALEAIENGQAVTITIAPGRIALTVADSIPQPAAAAEKGGAR